MGARMMTRVRYLEVIRPASAGDPRAVEEVVRAFRPLVLSIVKPFVGRNGAELEDLIQEGNLGLVFALRKYDPDRGAGFHTYAALWIKSRAQAWTRRTVMVGKFTSRADRVLLTRSFVARREIEQRLGGPSNHEQIAEALNLPVETVNDYYAKAIPAAPVLEDRDDDVSGGVIPTFRGADPEQTAELRERAAKVRLVMDRLDKRSREILLRRLDGEALEAIATDYGLTRERVRQVVELATRRVRSRVQLLL